MHLGIPLILVLGFLWSTTLGLTQTASHSYPPFTIVCTRVTLTAACMLLACFSIKHALPRSKKAWLHGLVLGFFSASFPFSLFAYALDHIYTMWAAVITGLNPILTVLFCKLLRVKNEPISKAKLFGIALGFLGIIALVLPTLFDRSIEEDTIALLCALIGTHSYAFGIVYTRKYLHNSPGLSSTATQMITASCYMIPLACIVDTPWALDNISTTATISLISLGFFGTTVAFLIYFHINKTYGATFLSMIGYLIPIIGTCIGITVFKEPLTLNFLFALIFILSSMVLVNISTLKQIPQASLN